MDDYIYDFGPKGLVATYTSTDFVGKYYKDGRIKAYVYPDNTESGGLLERYRENWDLL